MTGDSEPDFIIPAIRGAAGRGSDRESFTWFWFEKYGPGTIKVKNNSKDLRMESKLYNGTLLLAGSDIMTNEVQLLGGNLAIEAGKANNGWLNETANEFNDMNVKLSNGQTASISVRSIASGAASDYICNNVYVPQAYTPSNELFGEYVMSQGADIEEYEERLASGM